MKVPRGVRRRCVAAIAGVLLFPCLAGAIEVDGLKDFEPLYGRYAPAGDCSRQPQILVDAAGFTFERERREGAGDPRRVRGELWRERLPGHHQWFFPFKSANGWPILMAFNANEKRAR